jgi:hypothetical protein
MMRPAYTMCSLWQEGHRRSRVSGSADSGAVEGSSSRAEPTPTGGTTGRSGGMYGIWATPLSTPQRDTGASSGSVGPTPDARGRDACVNQRTPVVGGASLPQTAAPWASNYNPRKLWGTGPPRGWGCQRAALRARSSPSSGSAAPIPCSPGDPACPRAAPVRRAAQGSPADPAVRRAARCWAGRTPWHTLGSDTRS